MIEVANKSTIGDFLKQVRREVTLENKKKYKLLGVKWYGQGMFLREEKYGHEIKANKLYQVRKGDIVYNRLFAWKSSFAIVEEELDGCFVSNEFPTFTYNTAILDPHFLLNYILQPEYIDFVNRKSGGMSSVSRKRFKEEDFIQSKFPEISIDSQHHISEKISNYKEHITNLNVQLKEQSTYLSLLRQCILQEAIKGKLTAGWRKKHPAKPGNPETDATALLEKIKNEKSKLIVEGKIKKEKPLAPIKPDEVPFDLPEGWVWTRLGDVTIKSEAGKSLRCEERKVEANEWGIIKVSAVSWDDFSENENKYYSKHKPSFANAKISRSEFLISRANTYELIGKSVIVKEISKNLLLSDKIVRFFFGGNIDSSYINYFNNSPLSRKHYVNRATGASASMKNITRIDMYENLIPLPPLAEQHVIVEQVDCLIGKVNDLEKQVADRKIQAGELMQAILREAFEDQKSPSVNPEFPVSVESISSALSTSEPELNNFKKLQVLGSVIEILAEQRQAQGEMILAKYLYLLHFIYKINAGFQFKKWHFGPYDPEIKKVSNNRGYFRKTGKTGYETISVLNKERLFKYDNRVVQQIRENLPDIVSIFGKYKNPEERSHKIELLASVLKVIEDTDKSDLDSVYYEFARWTTDEKKTGFTSKAEKFSEEEVEKVLGFIKKQKWA